MNRAACLVVEWKSVLTSGDEVLLEELGLVYERRFLDLFGTANHSVRDASCGSSSVKNEV